MPYNPASTSRGIEVSAITVKLEVSPRPPWTAGQTLTFTATVLTDSEPLPGARVYFYWGNADTGYRSFTYKETGADGKAVVEWEIPWTWEGPLGKSTVPCKSNMAHAVYSVYRSEAITGLVAYPTRISISAPDRVPTETRFEISGKLEYESDKGVWSPLAGRTVTLYYNTTKIADVTTGSDGSYSVPFTIPSPGTYTLRAVFAGEGLAFPPAFRLHGLSVGFPPELAPLAQYAPYALAAIPLILVGGAIAYSQLAPGS